MTAGPLRSVHLTLLFYLFACSLLSTGASGSDGSLRAKRLGGRRFIGGYEPSAGWYVKRAGGGRPFYGLVAKRPGARAFFGDADPWGDGLTTNYYYGMYRPYRSLPNWYRRKRMGGRAFFAERPYGFWDNVDSAGYY